MPFIPHTVSDIKHMLEVIGVDSIDSLFDEIPSALPRAILNDFPLGLQEASVTRLMMERMPPLNLGGCFIGAGAYEHHIPAVVSEIVSRGEFYTAYTPYQAEASQGSLQVIYEYQTMMAQLMGLEVSNASQYDGASALAEAVLMAVRIKRNKASRVVVLETVHPAYRKVLSAVLACQNIDIETVPFDLTEGRVLPSSLKKISAAELAAVIIPQPNFFGVLELVDELTQVAHSKNALVIALVNPMSAALLKEPGAWGDRGVDIACGEGQPMGIPLASGGPYFGFLTCKRDYLRQLPGRIVGRTQDSRGRDGFTLTLQAREQHIRRSKATSNICTNQGLMVVAATIYMSLLGAKGLRQVATTSHRNANHLLQKLTSVAGVDRVFQSPIFHEFVVKLQRPVSKVLMELVKVGVQGGYPLQADYPQLGESLLVCATETKTSQDLVRYQAALKKIMCPNESK